MRSIIDSQAKTRTSSCRATLEDKKEVLKALQADIKDEVSPVKEQFIIIYLATECDGSNLAMANLTNHMIST